MMNQINTNEPNVKDILLKSFYSKDKDETSREIFERATKCFSDGDTDLEERLLGYLDNKWMMYSSPILSNSTLPSDKIKAMPISCFLSYVPDSVNGLIDHTSELRMLSVKGGGVGGHWSSVRGISDISPGLIPFLKTVDADMCAYRQGKTRKGSYAAYLDIHHPDIVEFIRMRIPTGGDVNRKCLNLHHGVNITDDFMIKVKKGGILELKSPATGLVTEELSARYLWELLLETRYRTGEPYLNFIDTANDSLPKPLKDKGLKIHGSNLCNEIHLPTSTDRTAVCCLSSLNLEFFDDWEDSDIVEDLTLFLDNVLDFFIKHAGKGMEKGVYSATRERSIGIGAMGFHSYLQRHDIPYGSEKCRNINDYMFRIIKQKSLVMSRKMAVLKGEAPDMKGHGVRNSHLLAVAPNANSSVICGCSPCIEPWKSNGFTHRTRAGSFLVRNAYLTSLLDKLGKNDEDTWSSIVSSGGSVQHLDFLTQNQKDVFKTAIEIEQSDLITLAADRQKYICQGQSLNLFFKSGERKKTLHDIHYSAWEKKLKGVYYLRTESVSKVKFDQCLACQG